MKLKILCRATMYFCIYGIPSMWNHKKIHIKASWIAAKIMAKIDYNKQKRNKRCV